MLDSLCIFFIAGLIGNKYYKTSKSKRKSNSAEIIIVTIANEKVKNSLFECINYTYTKFPNISISIIVDEGAQLMDSLTEHINQDKQNKTLQNNFIDNTKRGLKIENRNKNIHKIIVPNNYRQDLLAKGRAINYFVENYVKDNKWYILLMMIALFLMIDFYMKFHFMWQKDMLLLIKLLNKGKT